VFVNRVRNYIYGFFDGTTTDLLDESGNVEESISNLFFTQADAQLRGGEAELAYGKSNGVQARLWGDTVRARLTSGANRDGNLPRMSPSRLGLDLGWRADAWSATLFVTRVLEQDKVSSFDLRDGVAESATPGYTRVDLGLVWRLPLPTVAAPLTLFLQGRNLTDQDIRVHTSFLKGVAPPPGRSVVLGLRAAI
jgi:iron complex outermembrane receptor protein